jgi:hypothetical protein
MFGLSVLKAVDETNKYIPINKSQRLSSDLQDSMSSNDVESFNRSPSLTKSLLYRKNQMIFLQELDQSKANSTTSQKLVDEVILKKSSSNKIIGNAFRQVLHEMLLNQVSDINNKNEESLRNLHLTLISSPSRKSNHKKNNGNGKDGNCGDDFSSPSSPSRQTRKSSNKRLSLVSSLSTVKERSESF